MPHIVGHGAGGKSSRHVGQRHIRLGLAAGGSLPKRRWHPGAGTLLWSTAVVTGLHVHQVVYNMRKLFVCFLINYYKTVLDSNSLIFQWTNHLNLLHLAEIKRSRTLAVQFLKSIYPHYQIYVGSPVSPGRII